MPKPTEKTDEDHDLSTHLSAPLWRLERHVMTPDAELFTRIAHAIDPRPDHLPVKVAERLEHVLDHHPRTISRWAGGQSDIDPQEWARLGVQLQKQHDAIVDLIHQCRLKSIEVMPSIRSN